MDTNQQILIENIKKCYNEFVNKDGKTLIVSVLAYKSYICVLDLILNITYFFRNFNIKILLSLTDDIIDVTINFDHVYIHNITDNKISLWGTIGIFHQHYLAYKFCINKMIKYDYFVFCLSNQLFFKDITEHNIKKIVTSIENVDIKTDKLNDEQYDNYFNNFFNNKNKWVWYDKTFRDKYFTSYMKNNKYIYHNCLHEGLVFDFVTSSCMFNEYEKYDFHTRNTNYNYCFEELFPPIFIQNKFNYDKEIKSLCSVYIFNPKLAHKSLNELVEYFNDDHIFIH